MKPHFATILISSLSNILLFSGLMSPAQSMDTLAREATIVDMHTGTYLLEKKADTPMPPASSGIELTPATLNGTP